MVHKKLHYWYDNLDTYCGDVARSNEVTFQWRGVTCEKCRAMKKESAPSSTTNRGYTDALAAPTPGGKICRCDAGNRWRVFQSFIINDFVFCPSCGGKLLLT